MNGKTYRLFNTYVTYYMSTLNRLHYASLINRRENIGVTGDYFRVIYTNSNHKVDVKGIDYHEITSIPLVTAGIITSSLIE